MDFPINAMLKWGEQFQAACFDQEKKYTYRKFTKIWSGANKWKFQEEEIPYEL